MSKILVVDDEAIITMQVGERLSAMDYSVAGMAAFGEDAVEKKCLLPTPLNDTCPPLRVTGIVATVPDC